MGFVVFLSSWKCQAQELRDSWTNSYVRYSHVKEQNMKNVTQVLWLGSQSDFFGQDTTIIVYFDNIENPYSLSYSRLFSSTTTMSYYISLASIPSLKWWLG